MGVGRRFCVVVAVFVVVVEDLRTEESVGVFVSL